MKLIHDKRIDELRRLIQETADGKAAFDEAFAKRTLKEVLEVERQVSRYRNIISYLTLPLDFIPWAGTIAQKAGEEIAGGIVDNKMKQKYQWFYMLSDIVEQPDPVSL